jgi:ABC-2 type transport system permease protein
MSEIGEMALRLSAVVDRDWKKFRRNPVVIAMSILMPILYLVILGNSFQGKLRGLPIVVVNQDSGPYSRSLLDNLRAIAAGPRTLAIHDEVDESAAVAGVRNGTYKAALIIPPDFSKKVVLKSHPEVGLFVDNTDSISSQTLQGAVNGAIGAIGSDYVAIRERLGEIQLRAINLYRQVDYFQSLVPGVVIMSIFLGTMTTGVFNIVMDRFLGVEEAYLLTPLTRTDIVAGLILSGLSITTAVAVLVLAVSIVLTGIPLPDSSRQYALVLLIVILTTLSLLSLMFTVLGRANHPRIVGILSGFLNVILFFPSGAIYPIASLPGWLRDLAQINPEAYAVDALKAVLFKNAGLMTVSWDLAFLAAFAAVMMTVSIVLFRRTL